MNTLRAALTPALILFAGLFIFTAEEEHHHTGGSEKMEQLGKVSFPTSCSPAVQESFERGVAFLHSFQYEAAEKRFSRVAQQDPKCAMAFWGVAMSFYHLIWERPDAESLKKGWAQVEKAEALGAKTAREREYIAALATFYQEPEKRDYAGRARAYAKAMEQIYQHYPEDGEAAAFYSVSLLAPDVVSAANRKEAIAILDKLFAQQPEHPGAAHYLIHAADTPQLASLGLDAARRYAKIAPSAAHAIHMPSHIFTRLGLWQESIDSNLASAAAAEEATLTHMGDSGYQLHAMSFLDYAYLQSGREADAKHLIEELKTVPGTTPEQLAYSTANFSARFAIELHHWAEAAALIPPPHSNLLAQEVTYWARAIGAARSGNIAGARQDVRTLSTLQAAIQAKNKDYEPYPSNSFDQQEAEAWLAFAQGRTDQALVTLRAAADLEDFARRDSLFMPAREMLGDILLELKQPAQALAEYEASLKEEPSRFDGLYGAARAAELAGNSEKAKAYYAKLAAFDHPGSDRSELREAKLFLLRTR